MSESITPPDVPRVFLIPVTPLFSGLKFLFAEVADIENNEQDSMAFAEIFQQTAIYLVQKSISYQNVSTNVFAILQMYRINVEHYMSLMQNVTTVIDASIEQIDRSAEMLRYHYIVDVQYQLVANHTLQVTLQTTVPSRDYVSVLRDEVLKARENNEFVPYKYLILAGLA